MKQIATLTDFRNLPPHAQAKYEAVLRTCQQQNLSVRCELNGRDFTIVIAPGLSNAAWFLERFGLSV